MCIRDRYNPDKLLAGTRREVQKVTVTIIITRPTDTEPAEYKDVYKRQALSFSLSNVYRIYHEGIPIAEVCKEYLKSASLTSRAVIALSLIHIYKRHGYH